MKFHFFVLAYCLLILACGDTSKSQHENAQELKQVQRIDSIANEVEKAGEEIQLKTKKATEEIDVLLDGI